ncbi:MAG: SGNH/GDSL hydrolase family protein [Pseudohongiella sp.]|uniref:SGNH/GDSL hydrolase family protein n=1 Tax=Pseudohongiella sp. TaxID=1979412 RepID=UPI0034A0124E
MTRITTIVTLGCALLAATLGHAQALVDTLQPGARYVALGSSFAAGPGVPEQLGNCGRSSRNYANLVAEALDLSLVDVSCNGATTDNIRHTPQNGAAPQIDAVTADTMLVTVTIGGNDIRYTASTFACAGTSVEENCTANLNQDAINDAVSQLPAKLAATIEAIRDKAPQAAVVLVTYPRVFPDDAVSCAELELSAEDTRYLAALGQTLQDIFVNVSATQQNLIADSYVLGEGHGPCADPVTERWINGNVVASSGVRYHPTAEGYEEMARLVLAALGHQ